MDIVGIIQTVTSKQDLIKLINAENHGLAIWCTSSSDNILTKKYSYLWEEVNTKSKTTIEKILTFQAKKVNTKGERDTFDLYIEQKRREKGAIYITTYTATKIR